VVKSNFIRKGGAAVTRTALPSHRQQRIVSNSKISGGPRKSHLRSLEPREKSLPRSSTQLRESEPGHAISNQPKLLQTIDPTESQPPSNNLEQIKTNKSDKNRMRTIQTVQVDFDADMPVEGRNAEDENKSPEMMVFDKNIDNDSPRHRGPIIAKDAKEQYGNYLNDDYQQRRANEALDADQHQSEQVADSTLQKPVQSIQSLENLVKLRQRLDKDLSNKNDANSKSLLKNE